MTALEEETPAPGGALGSEGHTDEAGDHEHNADDAGESFIALSLGQGKYDATPQQLLLPDAESLFDLIEGTRNTEKHGRYIAGPCGVAQDDEKHREDASMSKAIGHHHRCGVCVQPTGFLGLDVDGGLTAESFHALVQILQPHQAIVYTTASSQPDAPRCRVIAVLDRPLGRDQRRAASAVFRAQLDVALRAAGFEPPEWDVGCDRPEQPLYLPLIGGSIYRTQGAPLVADHLLAQEPEPEPLHRPEPALRPTAQVVSVDGYALTALRRAAENVYAAPPGTRNDVLNREAYSIGGLEAAGRLPAGLAKSTLLDAARRAGYDNLQKVEATIVGAVAAGRVQPRLDGLPPLSLVPQPEAETASLVRVDLAGLRAAALTRTAYAIDKIVPLRVVTLLSGHGGMGKSTLALTMAAHKASGRAWAGLEVGPAARVVFVSLEDEGEIVRVRLRDIADQFGLDFELIEQNLVVLDGTDGDAALVAEVQAGGARQVRPTALFRALEDATVGSGLIVIDNASDAFDGNENDRRQVRYYLRLLTHLARERDAGLVLLSHIDKQAALHGSRGNGYSGSTAWHNSARSRLVMSEKAGLVALAHEKANLGQRAEPLWFRRGDGGVLLPVVDIPLGSSERADEQSDMDAVLAAIRAACRAGISITTAAGNNASAWKTLRTLDELPKPLRGPRGKARVEDALVRLERQKLIERAAYVNESRNRRERWEVVGEPFAGRAPDASVRSLPPPLYTPRRATRPTQSVRCPR